MCRSTTPQQQSNSSLCTDHRLDVGGGICAWKTTPRLKPNCRKSFQACSSIETPQHHQEMCYQDEGVVINKPKPGKDTHRFKNLAACWYVPRVIYFDLKSLLLPLYDPTPPNPTLKNLAPKQKRFIIHAVTL